MKDISETESCLTMGGPAPKPDRGRRHGHSPISGMLGGLEPRRRPFSSISGTGGRISCIAAHSARCCALPT